MSVKPHISVVIRGALLLLQSELGLKTLTSVEVNVSESKPPLCVSCRTRDRSGHQRLGLCIPITVAPPGLLCLCFLQVLIALALRVSSPTLSHCYCYLTTSLSTTSPPLPPDCLHHVTKPYVPWSTAYEIIKCFRSKVQPKETVNLRKANSLRLCIVCSI